MFAAVVQHGARQVFEALSLSPAPRVARRSRPTASMAMASPLSSLASPRCGRLLSQVCLAAARDEACAVGLQQGGVGRVDGVRRGVQRETPPCRYS